MTTAFSAGAVGGSSAGTSSPAGGLGGAAPPSICWAKFCRASTVAELAEDRLRAVVVEARGERELLAVGVPAGEGAGGFADVRLGVIAHAEGEQLHHLPGVVLVRLTLDVAVGVEPDEHGRVAAHVG